MTRRARTARRLTASRRRPPNNLTPAAPAPASPQGSLRGGEGQPLRLPGAPASGGGRRRMWEAGWCRPCRRTQALPRSSSPSPACCTSWRPATPACRGREPQRRPLCVGESKPQRFDGSRAWEGGAGAQEWFEEQRRLDGRVGGLPSLCCRRPRRAQRSQAPRAQPHALPPPAGPPGAAFHAASRQAGEQWRPEYRRPAARRHGRRSSASQTGRGEASSASQTASVI